MSRSLVNSDLLEPGDVAEFVYDVRGPLYVRAAHVAAVEERFRKDPRLRYRGYTYPDGDETEMVFLVKVVTPPPDAEPQYQKAGVSVAVVAGLIAVGSGLLWLSLREVRLISEATGESPITSVAGAAKAGFRMVSVGVTLFVAYSIAKTQGWIK